MTEEMQILLMQYADGTLDEAERGRVEALLRDQPELQAYVEEERELTEALRGGAALPAINWEALAQHIGEQIDEAEVPANPYSLAWLRRGAAAAFAVAACVLIGLTIYFRGGPGVVPPQEGPISVAITEPEKPTGAAIEQIEIGPPSGMAAIQSSLLQSEALVARPSRVLIAGGDIPWTDTSSLPF